MSNFSRLTKNPFTGRWEQALWMDDFFGKGNYGVKFRSGFIVNPKTTELEVEKGDDAPQEPKEHRAKNS